MREVYINGEQVDVNQSDAVDIIYESPIFSDISKIKSNTTTTYTLPKTDRNLAIFRNADQHDVEQMYKDENGKETSMSYAEQRFDEYRNGLPIIQNGRCRLLKIADKIELAVVWGTKVPLSEKLSKKLYEIDDALYEEDGNIIETGAHALWSRDEFLKVEPIPENETIDEKLLRLKNKPFGFLFADFGQGVFNGENSKANINLKYIFPSASVGYILEKAIARHAEIKVDIDDKEMLATLYECWIPCVTKKMSQNVNAASASAMFEFDPLFNEMSMLSITSGRQYNFINEKQGALKIPVGSYDVIFKKTTQSENIEVFHWVDISKPEGYYTKNWELILKVGNIYHKWNSVIAEEHKIYNKKLLQLAVAENIKFEEVLTNTNLDIIGSYNLKFYFKNTNLGLEIPFESISHEDEIVMPSLPVSVTVKQRIDKDAVIPLDTNFPIMANLPDMTCIDFIKSVCQMYALFPYFDIKNNTLKFLQIDDIYENKDKAKNWDDKVLVEDWSIERSFGDYAKKNLFRYAEDDTVKTISQDYLVLEDSTLDAEKELIDLKFSATDMSGNLASLPIYGSKEGGVAPEKPQTIKPRILSEGRIRIQEDGDFNYYKALVFGDSMRFEGNEGLIKRCYERYRDVVSKPVVRDVKILLSEVELMNMSTLDIIYLRGKYWMPIKIQVGIDGKASVRLILLPEVFE